MGADFEEWKKHFLDQARGLIPHQRNFYKVSEQRGKGAGETNIKMVSPTQQVVERAKSTLSNPPTVYDPVTGVVHRPESSSKTTRIPKRKYTSRKVTNPKKYKKEKKKKKTRKINKKKKCKKVSRKNLSKKKKPKSKKWW